MNRRKFLSLLGISSVSLPVIASGLGDDEVISNGTSPFLRMYENGQLTPNEVRKYDEHMKYTMQELYVKTQPGDKIIKKVFVNNTIISEVVMPIDYFLFYAIMGTGKGYE